MVTAVTKLPAMRTEISQLQNTVEQQREINVRLTNKTTKLQSELNKNSQQLAFAKIGTLEAKVLTLEYDNHMLKTGAVGWVHGIYTWEVTDCYVPSRMASPSFNISGSVVLVGFDVAV
jgi:hypothetical protein